MFLWINHNLVVNFTIGSDEVDKILLSTLEETT